MENIVQKLKLAQGKELKYGQLCDELGLPKKGGKGKNVQLKNLQLYCELEKLEKPTRFIIKKVYEEEIKAFQKVNGNNKYQTMFDAVIYQTFLANDGEPLFLSSTEMLKLFAEVNENFTYSYNSTQMYKLGEDFISFSEMSKIARKILVRWTKDRLNNMSNRSLLVQSKAYRLYTQHLGSFGPFKVGHNFPATSETGKKCMAIIAQSIDEIVPESYKSGLNETDMDKKMWLPLPIWEDVNKRITELTKEEFNGEYCDLKEIIALYPPDTEWIVDKLTNIYKSLPALSEINNEACRKILSTSQLDNFTGKERKKFVDVNMALRPSFSIKMELTKLKEQEKESA